MTGIVLAAGKSRRMGNAIPKVLMPLGGQPIVKYVIDSCWASGIEQVLVVVGDRRDQVEKALAGTGVEFVTQREQLGTAHAVLACADKVQERETVIVLYGDVPLIRTETLRRLVATLEHQRADMVLLTATVANPTGYGRIVRGPDRNILAIVEERDATLEQKRIREMNVGLYALHWRQVLPVLREVQPSPSSGEYYLTDAVALLARRGGTVIGVTTADPSEFMGVNSPEDLAQVEAQLALRRRNTDNARAD